VVFSNPRSGSIWLDTMLGLLPDVHVDYELKWDTTYIPSDKHAVLHEHSKTISQLLEDMDTDAPVTGSKFVFDVLGLTPIDFRKLTSRIGSDIRIIHLMRNCRDVSLSIRRGFHHSPARTEELSARLSGALNTADIRHAQPRTPHYIPPIICFNELSALLDSDIRIHSLYAAASHTCKFSMRRSATNWSISPDLPAAKPRQRSLQTCWRDPRSSSCRLSRAPV
jgi:hypothetical protein